MNALTDAQKWKNKSKTDDYNMLTGNYYPLQWELKENLLFATFFSDGYGPVADRQNHTDQQTLVNHGNPVRKAQTKLRRKMS